MVFPPPSKNCSLSFLMNSTGDRETLLSYFPIFTEHWTELVSLISLSHSLLFRFSLLIKVLVFVVRRSILLFLMFFFFVSWNRSKQESLSHRILTSSLESLQSCCQKEYCASLLSLWSLDSLWLSRKNEEKTTTGETHTTCLNIVKWIHDTHSSVTCCLNVFVFSCKKCLFPSFSSLFFYSLFENYNYLSIRQSITDWYFRWSFSFCTLRSPTIVSHSLLSFRVTFSLESTKQQHHRRWKKKGIKKLQETKDRSKSQGMRTHVILSLSPFFMPEQSL